jgi:competence ComEA-like helix-hairpin-helix protein
MNGSDPPPAGDARLACVLAAALLAAAVAARVAGRGPAPAAVRFERWLVDVNTAPAAEIEALPGVGTVLAARIVEGRAKGPFDSIDDLARVPGVGPTTIERLRAFVRCGSR